MEGGGMSSSTGGGLQLSNIGDYKEIEDIYTIVGSSIFTLFLSIVAARLGNVGGFTVNTYFDMFGLEGVLSNTMLMTLLLQFSRYLYTSFYGSYGKTWSPFVFLCIVASVQALHDLIFYYGVINVLPSGVNQMIDILKQYAKDNDVRAIGGHIALLVITALVAMTMKDMSDIQKLLLTSIVLYLIPYFLSVITKKREPPPPPPAKKEEMRDYRGY
jgi:hypothetical protein